MAYEDDEFPSDFDFAKAAKEAAKIQLCSECGCVKNHPNHWAPFGWHNFTTEKTED
jgi:hypothetical protein